MEGHCLSDGRGEHAAGVFLNELGCRLLETLPHVPLRPHHLGYTNSLRVTAKQVINIYINHNCSYNAEGSHLSFVRRPVKTIFKR